MAFDLSKQWLSLPAIGSMWDLFLSFDGKKNCTLSNFLSQIYENVGTICRVCESSNLKRKVFFG
jgi:hypothetical protein